MNVTAAMVKELREATNAGILDCQKALLAHDGNFDRAAESLREKGLAKAANRADHETSAGLVVVKSDAKSACLVEVNCETDFVARTDDFKTFVHRIAEQVLADSELTDPATLLAVDFIDAAGTSVAKIVQGLISKLGENIVIGNITRFSTDDTGLIEGYIHAGAIDGFYGQMEGRLGVLVQMSSNGTANQQALRDLAHDIALQITSASPLYVSPEDIPGEVMQHTRETIMSQVPQGKPEAIQAKIVDGKLNSYYQQVCLLKQAFLKDDSISVETLLQQRSAEIGAQVRIERFARFEIGANIGSEVSENG
jgi:elongation factor Ts